MDKNEERTRSFLWRFTWVTCLGTRNPVVRNHFYAPHVRIPASITAIMAAFNDADEINAVLTKHIDVPGVSVSIIRNYEVGYYYTYAYSAARD